MATVKTVRSCTIAVEDLQGIKLAPIFSPFYPSPSLSLVMKSNANETKTDRGPNPPCFNISKELLVFLAASAISRKCSQKDDDRVWVTATGETTFFVPGEEGDLVRLARYHSLLLRERFGARK